MTEVPLINNNIPEFYSKIVKENPSFRNFVEIGVWNGDSITHLCQELKKLNRKFHAHAVDLWTSLVVPKEHEEAQKLSLTRFIEKIKVNELGTNITLHQVDSTMAAELFKDGYFDLIFIDANHTYKKMKEDALAWRPKLKEGGVIAGHDYTEPSCGVKQAVDEVFGDRVLLYETIWYLNG